MGLSIGGIVDKAKNVAGTLATQGNPWGVAYDIYNYTQRGGGGGEGPTQAQHVRTAQDKIALEGLMGGEGIRTEQARARLARTGSGIEGGDPYAYLAKLAAQGGVQGKKAKLYTQLIALQNTGEAAKIAATTGTDQVAKAYQTNTEAFTGALGPGVDVNSPALLDAIRRYTEGRSSDTQSLLTNLKGQEFAQKNAILLNQIAPTLDETGALVESLKMLKQEQNSLRNAQYTQLGMSAAGMGLKAFGVGGYGLPTVVNQA
jgi:hypothetical protein